LSQVAVRGSDSGRASRPRVFVGALVPVELRQGLIDRAASNGRSVAAELRRATAVYLEVDDTQAGLLLAEKGESWLP
jgi:hypothetical protein